MNQLENQKKLNFKLGLNNQIQGLQQQNQLQES